MAWTNYTLKINNDSNYPILNNIYSGIWDGTPGSQGSLPGLDNLNYLNVEFDTLTGPVNWTTNQNIGTATKDVVFTLLRVNGNLTVANSITVTTPVRKLGLGILVTGNLVMGSGSIIDMTGKGANHRGRNQTGGSDSGFAINYPSRNIRLIQIAAASCLELNTSSPYAQNGSSYANPSLTNINGLGGSIDALPTTGKFQTGGGGRGSSVVTSGFPSAPNGFGANGSTFCGGSGGGGRNGTNTNAESGHPDGGAGGKGSTSQDSSYPTGGGSGNPGGLGRISTGADNNTYQGGTGSGGVIFLVVLGNITFGNSTIRSNGTSTTLSGRGEGGGSGGGNISVFVQGTISGASTLQANGGTCGGNADATTRIAGHNGANGSVNLYKVSGLTI